MGRLPTRDVEPEFQALADATPALIWVDDAEAGRTLVNRAWREFTGAGPSDDLGEGWRARVHPEDVERCTAVRAAAVAAGEPFELEYRLRRADGRYCWVLDRGAPVGDAGAYVGGCLDIDDRQRERERRRLLDTIGAAMDAETTEPGRRDVLVRSLVSEGLVDMARLVDVSQGRPQTVAVAAARAEDEQVMRELDPPWGLDHSLTGGVQLVTVDDDYLALSTTDEEQRGARRALGLGTVVVVPLRARGRVVGLLATARSASSPPLEEDDAALLGEIGQRAATALDNAALLAAEQATTRRLELLQRATAALSASPSPRAVARTTVHQLGELLGTGAVGVWRRRDNTLLLLDGAGWGPAVQAAWARIPVAARTPFSDTARDGSSRWLRTPQEWMRGYPETYAELVDTGYPSLLTLPLMVGSDRIGAIAVGLARHGSGRRRPLGRARARRPVRPRAAAGGPARRGVAGPAHGGGPVRRRVGALGGNDSGPGRRRDHPARAGARRGRGGGRAAQGRTARGAGGAPWTGPARRAAPAGPRGAHRARRLAGPLGRGRRAAVRRRRPAPARGPGDRGDRAVLRGGRAADGAEPARDHPDRRRAVRAGAGPRPAARRRARGRRHPAAQPAPPRAAADGPPRRRGALPARQRRHPGRRRLVRPDPGRRPPGRARRRRRRRTRARRRGRHGSAAQLAGQLPPRRPRPGGRAGAPRQLRRPHPRRPGQHGRLPHAGLAHRGAALRPRRTPAGAARGPRRDAVPRGGCGHGARRARAPVVRRGDGDRSRRAPRCCSTRTAWSNGAPR